MYRISVTTLEKFRRFRDKASIYDTEESLIETLSGVRRPSAYADIGSAFHKIVETGCANYVGGGVFEQKQENFTVRLNFDAVENALLYRSRFPGAEHEVHGGMDFHSPLFDIHVHGFADLKYDRVVRDIKTKYGTPHVEDYTNSCQWTFYLELFGCSLFYFDLFQFRGYDRRMEADTTCTSLISYEPVECVRTDGMEAYNRQIVNDFCAFIEDRKLHHLLKTKEDLYNA